MSIRVDVWGLLQHHFYPVIDYVLEEAKILHPTIEWDGKEITILWYIYNRFKDMDYNELEKELNEMSDARKREIVMEIVSYIVWMEFEKARKEGSKAF